MEKKYWCPIKLFRLSDNKNRAGIWWCQPFGLSLQSPKVNRWAISAQYCLKISLLCLNLKKVDTFGSNTESENETQNEDTTSVQ